MFINDHTPFTAKRSVVWVLLVTAGSEGSDVFQPSSEIDGLSASEPASAGRLGEHAKRCDAQFVNRNVVFEEVVINRTRKCGQVQLSLRFQHTDVLEEKRLSYFTGQQLSGLLPSFCGKEPRMDTDKHGYRNLHSRLFASIRGLKSPNRLPKSGDIGYVNPRGGLQ